METTYQIDRNNLMRDEDILLAINSRCQDPISDQNYLVWDRPGNILRSSY